MSEIASPRGTVTASAHRVIRLRPSIMLMLVRVRSAEATLELGLAKLKDRCTDAERRLVRLGAVRASTGEPHEDDVAETDPMAKLRNSSRMRRPGAADAPPERPAVNAVITGVWDISDRTMEDVLLLVDRLRFETSEDEETPAPPDVSAWSTDPQQAIQAMQAMMERIADPGREPSAKFVYVARPSLEQFAKTASDAFASVRQQAHVLASAAGMRLGSLTSIHSNWNPDSRSDKLMERQRCAALLASGSYELQEGEIASDDPRVAEVGFNVHATHQLLDPA